MAKVNRFYSPSRGQYISNYIPEEIPTQILGQALMGKQQAYNKQLDQMNTNRSMFDFEALSGYDTQRRDELKQQYESKLDEFSKQDLSQPLVQQEYMNFARNLRDNDDIKQIKSSYATHQKYSEIAEKIKAGKADENEEAFFRDYQDRYNIYTSKTGQGFKGQVQLGDPIIQRGTDIQGEVKTLFDDIRANGSEWASKLSSGVAYKAGWEGITDDRIKEQLNKSFDTFSKGAAAKQLGARFDNMNIPQGIPPSLYYNQLSSDEKKQYDEEKKNYIYNTALNLGKEFTFNKSSSGKAEALNTQRGEEREIAANQDAPLEVLSSTTTATGNNWGADKQMLTQTMQNKNKLAGDITVLNTIKNNFSNVIVENLDNQQLNMLAGAIDPNDPNLPQKIRSGEINQNELNKIIALKQSQLENLDIENNRIKENVNNALNSKYGNKYNGKDFAAINNQGQRLGQEIYKDAYTDVQKALQSGDQKTVDKYKSYFNNQDNKVAKDFAAYIQSVEDYNQAIRSPFFQEDYNKGKTAQQNKAIAVSPKKEFQAIQYREDGTYQTIGKLASPEMQIESWTNKNLNLVDIKVDGKSLGTGDKQKVIISSVDVPRRGKDKNTVVFNVMVQTGQVKPGPGGKLLPVMREAQMEVDGTNYDQLKSIQYESGLHPEDVMEVKNIGDKKYFKINPFTTNKATVENARQLAQLNHRDLVQDFESIENLNDGDSKTLRWNTSRGVVETKVFKTDDPNSPSRYLMYIKDGNKNVPIGVENQDQLMMQLINFKNELQFTK